MAIQVGDNAPTFTLPCRPGETVDLGEFLGKDTVVLLFFPLAFSPGCTAEMCHFRDAWEQYQSLNARVFGISVDSPFVVEKLRDEQNLPFPILSDFNKDVARQYGVLHEADWYGLRGVAKRSAFVIGCDGIVKYACTGNDPGEQVDFDAIHSAVQAA